VQVPFVPVVSWPALARTMQTMRQKGENGMGRSQHNRLSNRTEGFRMARSRDTGQIDSGAPTTYCPAGRCCGGNSVCFSENVRRLCYFRQHPNSMFHDSVQVFERDLLLGNLRISAVSVVAFYRFCIRFLKVRLFISLDICSVRRLFCL
jgi:hypothetical protein